MAAVIALLEQHGAYVEEFAVFDDVPSDRLYVRTVFRIRSATGQDLDALRARYAEVQAMPASRPSEAGRGIGKLLVLPSAVVRGGSAFEPISGS